MKIGVFGGGMLRAALASCLIELDHEVRTGSRG
jgi:predicted dinucleotide-binding enzyme